MTKKKPSGRKADRHKTKPFPVRLHPLLKEKLEELAARNFSSVTAEIVAAIRKHLKDNELLGDLPKGTTTPGADGG